MTHSELIENCLELVAEKSGDIAPDLYKRFFSLYPEAEELFGVDTADHVKGRMIMSLIEELMGYSEGLVYTENIKRWINDHRGYGVTLPMYPSMFDCLLATIEDLIGKDWTKEMKDAWQQQYDVLLEHIDYIYKEYS